MLVVRKMCYCFFITRNSPQRKPNELELLRERENSKLKVFISLIRFTTKPLEQILMMKPQTWGMSLARSEWNISSDSTTQFEFSSGKRFDIGGRVKLKSHCDSREKALKHHRLWWQKATWVSDKRKSRQCLCELKARFRIFSFLKSFR
jgi:hypothetical protein